MGPRRRSRGNLEFLLQAPAYFWSQFGFTIASAPAGEDSQDADCAARSPGSAGRSPCLGGKALHCNHTRIGVSVAEAAWQVGYESPSQFSREFKRLFGGTPKEIGRRSRSSLFAF